MNDYALSPENSRFVQSASKTVCHCEERSDVAIRTPSNAAIRYPLQQENGLPHQRARWFAMTV